jgi:adenylosuccinate synthase
MRAGQFNTIVDSAWGSSGKGAASTRLADIHNVEHLSSANYPNAGHTVRIAGETIVFKALPSGAALTKIGKRPKLWLGCNSGFYADVIVNEMRVTGYLGTKDVHIHDRAMVVETRHAAAEAPEGKQSTLTISSTMSGSGAAITEKAMRQPDVTLARDIRPEAEKPWDFWLGMQNRMILGQTFLHEVSQGFALSLNWGTHYPHCTSRDCTPQQAYADFGIQPHQAGDVYLNVRSLPIRVGNNFDAAGRQIGYSGDAMPDCQELTWGQVASEAEMPADEAAKLAERERTTVTKKIRRVFSPSWQLLEFSAKFCGATKLILNFPQYIHWSANKVRGDHLAKRSLHHKVRTYIDEMEDVTGLPVVMIGTGADHDDYIRCGD